MTASIKTTERVEIKVSGEPGTRHEGELGRLALVIVWDNIIGVVNTGNIDAHNKRAVDLDLRWQ